MKLARRISVYTGLIAACLGLCMGLSRMAVAAPLDNAATDAPPQHYVMTLAQSPVGEVAEEVLGQTLGLPVSVDPRVGGQMTFRVDGIYSPQGLAHELGVQLWSVNVALIEDRADGLVLIPEEALAEALSQGAVLIAPMPSAASTQRPQVSDEPVSVAPVRPSPDRLEREVPKMGLLLALTLGLGWLGGMLTPALLRALRSRTRGGLRPSGPPFPDLSDPLESVQGAVMVGEGRLTPDLVASDLAMPERPAQEGVEASLNVSGSQERPALARLTADTDGAAVISIDFRSKTG